MDKLKKIIGLSYYLLGFLEGEHENSVRSAYIDFKETIQSKSLTSIIDYLNSVLNSE